MLLLTIDRKSAVPIYRQIIDKVVHLVDGGTLSPGDRLPSSRILARSTGIHRSSVTRAYEELWALGYLESRPGSYSTIRRRARRLTGVERARPLLDWSAKVVPAARGARESSALLSRDRLAKSDSRDPRLLAPHRGRPAHAADAVRRCFKAVLREDGGQALQYGEPAGFRPLRETIALRLRTHGVDVTPEEIVVTGGAQQALDLLLRALARPGDRGRRRVAHLLGGSPPASASTASTSRAFRFVPRAWTSTRSNRHWQGNGPLSSTRSRTSTTRPAITTNQAHRERLLALCEKHRLPLVEDGFEEEMKYFGKAVLPIKSMDRRGIVAYVGTLSKVVFPGLAHRLDRRSAPVGGFRAGDPAAVQPLRQPPGPGRVHRFFATGAYEAHLRRVHKTYRRRMQAMIDGLRENLPRRGVSWTEPQGGYTLWLQVSGTKLAEQALHDRLLAAGVKLSSGRLFHAHAPRHPCFRVSIAAPRQTRSARAAGASAACCARRLRADMLLSPKDAIVYGPVRSRRLGRSLGINLLPASRKACSFDCQYCQYGFATPIARPTSGPGGLPDAGPGPRGRRGGARPCWLRPRPGSPSPATASPRATRLPRDRRPIISLRDRALPQARTAVLSNSSRLEQVEIRRALSRLDARIMKLDVGTEAGLRRFNQAVAGLPLESIVSGLARLGDVTLQSLFAGGPSGNLHPAEVAAWVEAVTRIRPLAVQLYTLDREAPSSGFTPRAAPTSWRRSASVWPRARFRPRSIELAAAHPRA